jgi:hypothetical protein
MQHFSTHGSPYQVKMLKKKKKIGAQNIRIPMKEISSYNYISD